ncbi:hypothetical protein B0A50_03032 [Salinomyces thailandicus]|uniref:Lytic polysaccharide monooxygenase n=1 Tax=Salinomyces thailandicus TaxID=706561 RepID=A0A4U0U1V9_9PEZI|nr:hypothetical protein B0A50_03032 [Salinomyces thailandica]
MTLVKSFTTGLAAFSTLAAGHLIITSPIPFGVDSLNNSPLVDAKPGTSQSDYPCKQRSGVYDISSMNHVQVGKPNLLSFEGSASHGGGTCQLVITTDLEPTANTTFKLFQTYEGNCPVVSDGNTGTDKFTWALPEGTPNGRLTFAWMWFNRIGNRELYMNCAPLDVTGGSDSSDFYESLPNAYVVNMPTEECATVDSADAEIPFPGQYVLKNPSASIVAATGPSCKASAAAMTEGVPAYKSATVKNAAATQAPAKNYDSTGAATGAATQSAAATSAEASSGFVTISTAATGSSSALAEISAYPTMSASSDAGVVAPSGYAAASGSSSSSGSSCSEDGAVVCSSDGKQFGLCNHGSVVFEAVADGTTCSNGQIQKKRSVGKRHEHMRKHGVQIEKRTNCTHDE